MLVFFKRLFASFLILFLINTFSSTAFPETPDAFSSLKSKSKKDAGDKIVPIQVHGDSVEYFQEEQKAVGIGHVSVEYEDVKLTADKITVLMASKDAVAEGNVVLTQKGSVFKGERVDYNFGTKVGNVSHMNAFIEPNFYGKAQRVERISASHYRTVNSYITTCCGDSPFYRVQAQQIDIYPDDRVVARNALLMIKGVPVLWVPYLVFYFVDFDRFPVQLIPGKNSQWGFFLLSKWRYNLVNTPSLQSKGNVLLDYREKRGFGGGVENFYRGDKIGHGAARVYYADDDEPPFDADSDRYRGQWRHQSKLGEATTFTAEINKLSDPSIIKDFFFREEYERDAFPDNYVSLITAKPEYTLSILDRERLNKFFTVVERSPEVRFDTYNRKFVDTPFYLRQEVQASNLRKEFADSDHELNAVRLDSNTTLSYAGHLGAVSVVPHVGTRQTYYSKDLASQRDVVRGTFDGGVDISTRFYKTYDVYINAFGLDYNQVRHIFTPTVSYNYRPNPTVARTTLPQFDALDALDKQNFIRYNFENKLQTKYHTSSGTLVSRELARIIPFFDTDLHTGRLDNVGIDVELRPYSWMGIEADVTYDTRISKVETANADFYMEKDNFRIGLGQRYVLETSSQTTFEVRWKINEEWEVKLYERYEFETDDSEEFEATVSKLFEDCYYIDFTYNHREAYGDSFYFVFRLKAFPKASFGLSQSYNRPKATPQGA